MLHNEVIQEVVIQAMGRTADGKKEVVRQKITLKEVKVVSHRQYMDKSAKEAGSSDVDVLEEVGFRFSDLQIENPEAGTATTWSWKLPNRTK
jgi:type VI protein secretion system component Hcp